MTIVQVGYCEELTTRYADNSAALDEPEIITEYEEKSDDALRVGGASSDSKTA